MQGFTIIDAVVAAAGGFVASVAVAPAGQLPTAAAEPSEPAAGATLVLHIDVRIEIVEPHVSRFPFTPAVVPSPPECAAARGLATVARPGDFPCGEQEAAHDVSEG